MLKVPHNPPLANGKEGAGLTVSAIRHTVEGMHSRRLASVLTGGVLAGALLVGVAAPASAATVSEPARKIPVPVAAVAGLESPRLDQDTTKTAIVTGASREAVVSVDWGDGASSSGRTTCSAARATRQPDACRLDLAHAYRFVGTFPITVRSGQRVIARTSVTVREAPRPWSPPQGWVQPAGWNHFTGGATYVPCSTVEWFYDRSAEPSASAGMGGEIVAGLARLAPETGLTFVETTDPSRADLVYSWGNLSGDYGEAAGVGGRSGGRGFVRFSTTNWWPTDQWPGFGIVTQPNGSYAVGRGWLVVHETMHALGMAHVNDTTQVMNPVAGFYSDLGAGDRDGLRTMYLNNPCPA